MTAPTYKPNIFDQENLEEAKSIILTPENGISTESRWEAETPWLLTLVRKHIPLSALVIDYGCGVGRMSAPLVDQGYSVAGVDTSESMRNHAARLLANKKFMAITPEVLDQIVQVFSKADVVLAIWVLQHCYSLTDEIERIERTLKKGGILVIADMKHRAVPTDKGWIDDGKSVKEALLQKFTLIQQYPYNAPSAPQNLRDNAYIAFFRKDR